MNKLDKIPHLRRLAKSKGITLDSVTFGHGRTGDGVLFVYSCDGIKTEQEYEDVDWGIEEELKRLRKL